MTTENLRSVMFDCLPAGDGGEQVAALQERLKEVGIEDLIPEGEHCVAADGLLFARGAVAGMAFIPEKIEERLEDIKGLLSNLPKEFQSEEGDGWSFLNACYTKDGDHWGEHRDIDELLLLGLAAGQVQILLPREGWKVFPAGMPYFRVLAERREIPQLQVGDAR